MEVLGFRAGQEKVSEGSCLRCRHCAGDNEVAAKGLSANVVVSKRPTMRADRGSNGDERSKRRSKRSLGLLLGDSL